MIGTLHARKSQCYMNVSRRNKLDRENTIYEVKKQKPVNKQSHKPLHVSNLQL